MFFISNFVALPVIQSQSSVDASAGQQAILHCSATGIDTPTISWASGGVDVGTSNNSRLTLHANGSLVINSTRVLDTGSYFCIAKNKAGTTTAVTALNVTGKS